MFSRITPSAEIRLKNIKQFSAVKCQINVLKIHFISFALAWVAILVTSRLVTATERFREIISSHLRNLLQASSSNAFLINFDNTSTFKLNFASCMQNWLSIIFVHLSYAWANITKLSVPTTFPMWLQCSCLSNNNMAIRNGKQLIDLF